MSMQGVKIIFFEFQHPGVEYKFTYNRKTRNHFFFEIGHMQKQIPANEKCTRIVVGNFLFAKVNPRLLIVFLDESVNLVISNQNETPIPLGGQGNIPSTCSCVLYKQLQSLKSIVTHDESL